jgi:hypothetical protein
MSRRPLGVVLLFLIAPSGRGAEPAYAVKVTERSPPPAEVAEPIRKLLRDRCVQLLDDKGELVAEVWGRAVVPAEATDAQIANGLTYREVPETTILGVVRFAREHSDYRKHKIPAGVYTLRLAFQPVSDDHVGTAPHPEFGLLSPAAEDPKPDTLTAKGLHERSAKTTGKHPAVLLLFPGTGAAADPKLVDKGSGHWTLFLLLDVKVGNKKATLPLGLNLVGASPSA